MLIITKEEFQMIKHFYHMTNMAMPYSPKTSASGVMKFKILVDLLLIITIFLIFLIYYDQYKRRIKKKKLSISPYR